jgi:CYTH domain-containing protein
MIEIERRFLVAATPDALPEPLRIGQAYLTTEPIAVRVRRLDDQHILTIKSGSGLERLEIERDLTADEFDALWNVATELRISKRRHRIDLGDDRVAELDLYDGDLSGHSIVEVEFPTVEAAARFRPPEWFGREVTDDGRYSNAGLARHGWPADD